MKILWLGARQYSPRYGTLEGVIDTKKRNIPDKVAQKWIDSDHAEEVKPKKASKSEKTTEVK